ncbi:MAG TPA: ribose 5-phosphate isomerase B [Terriglobales bacterium]|nr:ribose 5-phosphate isomerase B [Terriglobales bacterium]
MVIAFACDHGGFPLKARLLEAIRALGAEVLDLGTDSPAPVDYPDYAAALGRAIQQGRAERGVLVCGSGVGAAVAANKLDGIRAGLCHDCFSARQGVEDDNCNVLCLGARVVGPELAADLVRIFLAARFSGAERHQRRLAKVHQLELARP